MLYPAGHTLHAAPAHALRHSHTQPVLTVPHGADVADVRVAGRVRPDVVVDRVAHRAVAPLIVLRRARAAPSAVPAVGAYR